MKIAFRTLSCPIARAAFPIVGLLPIAFAQSPSAPTQKPAATTSATKADPARLKRDVEWLADDLREGRRAGTAKALECADYIATRLKSLELDPQGTQGFFQEFEVPLAPRTGGNSRLGVDAPGGNRQILPEGTEFVPLFCS